MGLPEKFPKKFFEPIISFFFLVCPWKVKNFSWGAQKKRDLKNCL
jgi:hypothetical protein